VRGLVLMSFPAFCKSSIVLALACLGYRPSISGMVLYIWPVCLIQDLRANLCFWPISKSVVSWAGVILRAPVPKSFSTKSSAIMGICLLVRGMVAVWPTNFLYLLSLGLTATATSTKIVSGRVVAIEIGP